MPEVEERIVRGLHIRIVGAGTPVLLLHGLGGSVISWSRIEAAIAADHRAICVDLRGFGCSDKPLDWPYTLHDHAADVLGLIEELDLRDLTIAGNSLGGGVALLVALSLAETRLSTLRGLALLDSIACPQPLPFFVSVLRTPLLGPTLLWLVPPRWGVRFVLGQVYHRASRIEPGFVEAYAEPLTTRGGRHGLVATARGMIPPDVDALMARLTTLDTPTLLLWGRQDRLVPLQQGRRLAALLPNAKLAVVDDCGHAPQEEQPNDTAAAILAFLGDLKRASSA